MKPGGFGKQENLTYEVEDGLRATSSLSITLLTIMVGNLRRAQSKYTT